MRFLLLFLTLGLVAYADRKFYDDDPLLREPKPRDVSKVTPRELSDIYDLFMHTLADVGERNKKGKVYPAQGINTLGDPLAGAWWNPRHYYRRMSIEELTRGPGSVSPPKPPYTIVKVKSQGITPGFTALDSRGVRYFFKFDPLTNPEMASAAEVIGERLLYALGYWVLDGYIVQIKREDLSVRPGLKHKNVRGLLELFEKPQLDKLLDRVPKNKDGSHRAFVSVEIEGDPVGQYEYVGTRSDDPNDIVPHEHRRDLRGFSVVCAWVAHDDSRALNSLDTLVTEGGVSFLRHYQSDLGSIFGSATTRPNSERSGGEYLFSWKGASKQFLTLGLAPEPWTRAKFSEFPSIGKIESKQFNPDTWVPEYPNPAFENALPDDQFWAAKQVMAFTNEEIAAIVHMGQYSDPAAEAYLTKVLIERRDKIGRVFFAKVLPLDRFRISEGRLVYEDLAAKHNTDPAGPFNVFWSRFDNLTQVTSPMNGATSFELPSGSEYMLAEIRSGIRPKQTVKVYVRNRGGRSEVVGVEHTW